MFLEHCRHIECVCVSFCLSKRERAGTDAPGDCTHGPVIISTGRSQEMHFTRSNSFLEDIHSSAVAPQSGLGLPLSQAVFGEAAGLSMPQGQDFPSHPTPTGLAQLSLALLTPICGFLEQKWGIKVCVVHLPALNIMEVFKTRDLWKAHHHSRHLGNER